MFDQIIQRLPELATLEATVTDLERKHTEGQARVQALAVKTAQAKENDLNREALALNRGRKVPKPTEPALAEQLAGAQRDLQVLERRLALANSARALYLAEHHAEILGLLERAHRAEGAKVAAAATEALGALAAYHLAEDSARNLQRLHPAPAQENVGSPESVSVVFGHVNTRNFTGGPQRGVLEGTLQYLISLGAATVVGAVEEGDDDQDAA
jgi:hypothetical protein